MLDQRTAPYGALLLRLSLGAPVLGAPLLEIFCSAGWPCPLVGKFAPNGYPWFVPWHGISAEFAGALLLIPGIYARWASLYAMPLMVGAAHFWLVRKGFYFTGAGCELPILWAIMLLVQALLGDGPYALKPSPPRWFSRRQGALALERMKQIS